MIFCPGRATGIPFASRIMQSANRFQQSTDHRFPSYLDCVYVRLSPFSAYDTTGRGILIGTFILAIRRK